MVWSRDEQESIYSLNFKIQDQYNLRKNTNNLKPQMVCFFFFTFKSKTLIYF